MQFHILSFEGPDPYSRAGALATRVEGLSEMLARLGFETHLWFIGDPELHGHERWDWISTRCAAGMAGIGTSRWRSWRMPFSR